MNGLVAYVCIAKEHPPQPATGTVEVYEGKLAYCPGTTATGKSFARGHVWAPTGGHGVTIEAVLKMHHASLVR